MKNIIIPDHDKFDKKLKAIIADGKNKLHVRMDFDGTITKAIVDGKAVPSILAFLYNENLLDGDFSKAGKELYNKYRPIEIDPRIDDSVKKSAMCEWWKAVINLMIEKKFSKRHIELITQNKLIRLREGFKEFAAMLDRGGIPLVVMSSSGLGVDAIAAILAGKGVFHKNIRIVSNRFVWDDNGFAVSAIEPIVHALDKNEETIRRLPQVAAAIKNRPNIFLLTDTVADITMVQEAEPERVLAFGFLNQNVGQLLNPFQKNFDIILLNDAPMDFVNQTLKQILTAK